LFLGWKWEVLFHIFSPFPKGGWGGEGGGGVFKGVGQLGDYFFAYDIKSLKKVDMLQLELKFTTNSLN
jgi:hypothetical protein